jgi:hypothetical protein
MCMDIDFRYMYPLLDYIIEPLESIGFSEEIVNFRENTG